MKYKIIESIFGRESVVRSDLTKSDAESLANTWNRKNAYIVYRVAPQGE